MKPVHLLSLVAALGAASSSTAFAWTAAEEADGWIRSDDVDEWYHDETTLRTGGIWGVSRFDGDPDTLDMTARTGDHHLTIMILPTKDAKGIRAVTDAKTKNARKSGGTPTAWALKLSTPGLTWVGSQYITRQPDDDGDLVDTLYVFGYVTDGTQYAVVDFIEDNPTPNLRPQFRLAPPGDTSRCGKRHPAGDAPEPAPHRGKR